jgi:hypothetical protein
MDYIYSDTLKKLMKRQPGILVHIIFIILILFLTIGGFVSYAQDKRIINQSINTLKVFDTNEDTMEYRRLTPIYLSEAFAANFDDTILSSFAIDENLNSYIISYKADDIDKYQDLIDYTYDEAINTTPAQVTFEGIPQPIDDMMKELAIDGYKVFWGTDTFDEFDITSVLGSYYLDVTQPRTIDYGFIGLMFIGVIALVGMYFYILKRAKEINKQTVMTKDRYKWNILQDIDKELIDPLAQAFKNKKLYLSNNYIVSGAFGFDVIPYDEIKQIYGIDLGRNRNRIVVVTNDGIKHDIVELILDAKGNALYNQIIDKIKELLPEVKYGFEDGIFSTACSNNSLEVDEVTEGARSNILLGILGAFLGAAIGGVLWIVIGKLGFIAGIAGFVMMSFSIQGYRKFSGLLDKKGKIISLLIAFIMIFGAQYMSYALEYCKAYYSGIYSISNLSYSFKNVFDFLSLTESWSYFLKDLAIGYALSIWSGYGIIKSTFSKNSE